MSNAKTAAYTMILLFKTVFGSEADLKLLKTLCSVQCQGLSICTVGHAALKRLAESGADAKAILAKDVELNAMQNVQQQKKKKRAAYLKDLEDARAAVLGAQELMMSIFGKNEEFLGNLQDLVDLDIAEIFLAHKCEGVGYEDVFNECVKVHSTNLCLQLQACGDAAVQACQGCQEGGGKYWRAQAPPTASVQDLNELMSKTIVDLSLKDLKKSTDEFIEVCAVVQFQNGFYK